MKKQNKYAYPIAWSKEDAGYAGFCAEFPGLSWLARTPEAALKGVGKLVKEMIADMERNEEPVPKPIALRNYSGKFVVRVLSEVHRQLARQAAETGVTINRLKGENSVVKTCIQ